MKRLGEFVFWVAFLTALTLYCLTVPSARPWNDSTSLALAYLGEIVRPPALPYPIWGFYVQVFGGPIILSILLTALAAGFLAALVCRHLGWRFAAGAALLWMFLPGIWNRAVCGQRGVCLLAMVVVFLWLLDVVLLWATRHAQIVKTLSAHEEVLKRGKVNRLAGWTFLGAAVLFALASVSFHDYRLGQPAGVFAKGVVAAAGGRIIVLDGIVDAQILRETNRTLSLRSDDAYRERLVERVRAEFPSETNLWVAAQVGPLAFVEAAVKKHHDRFYRMDGTSTTPEQWERRWAAFRPYLDSRDPFVRIARRLFGREGNAVANTLCDEDEEAAWQLYRRLYTEVDPGNLSALVNMSEMIRRGYAASGEEKSEVRERLELFFADANNRAHGREIARASGPVRADPEFMEKLASEAKKRIAAKIANGEKVAFSPELLSLLEWNAEMCRRKDAGNLAGAGRIARAILSNPKWHDFVPANAVMGAVASCEGDYIASERFFQLAMETTNRVATATLNDYADTLLHLGKLPEAEKFARRAVGQSKDDAWLSRLTLAEVLSRKIRKKMGTESDRTEIKALLKSILRSAPPEVRENVRKTFRSYLK